MALASMFHRDDGTQDIPGKNSPWHSWVSAARTRNYINGDPLLDWLEEYGEGKGFKKDPLKDGYDPRTDFLLFVFAKGNQFEKAVLDYLQPRIPVTRIANEPREVREAAAAERTWDAMAGGIEVIAQAVLWNPQTQTYGAADLLIRSDVLARLFPSAISSVDMARPAPTCRRLVGTIGWSMSSSPHSTSSWTATAPASTRGTWRRFGYTTKPWGVSRDGRPPLPTSWAVRGSRATNGGSPRWRGSSAWTASTSSGEKVCS